METVDMAIENQGAEFFDGGDLDPLIKTIRLIPDLEMVAFAGKVARQLHLTYPLVNHNSLFPLFQNKREVTFHGHKVTCSMDRRVMFALRAITIRPA
jgi:hypothetical protein